MNSPDYIAAALRTESVPTSFEIDQVALHAILSLSIHAGKIADMAKRRIFYGTPIDNAKLAPLITMVGNMAAYLYLNIEHDSELDTVKSQQQLDSYDLPDEVKSINLANLNVRLLHAALGCFTESGELLEPILAQYEGKPLDKVNFGEEVGDIEWYQAIGFDETGVTEASCREKNIAKLKKRYPDKFDAVAAVNRDLAGERAILEGDDTPGPRGHETITPVDAGSIAAIFSAAPIGKDQ